MTSTRIMRKQSRILSAFVSASVLFSCTGKSPDPTGLLVCTQLSLDTGSTKAFVALGVAPHESLWPHSIDFPLHITVKFLNGTDFQKQKVLQYARQWNDVSAEAGGARKIRLRFLPYDGTSSGNAADIRVVFRPGGSASYLGTDAQAIHPDSPTVFFGWVEPNRTEEEIRSVVLHEFGHVLGLVHEHQHPGNNIKWNTERVYDYYARTQHPPWSREKVDRNIFARYNTATSNTSAYDRASIMHYSFPAYLTTDGSSFPWNTKLSAGDSVFIKQLYRYQHPCIPNEREQGGNCCFNRKGRRIPCR